MTEHDSLGLSEKQFENLYLHFRYSDLSGPRFSFLITETATLDLVYAHTNQNILYHNAAVPIESSPVTHSRSLLTFKTLQRTTRLDDHRAGRQGTCSSIRLQQPVHLLLHIAASSKLHQVGRKCCQ